MKKTQSALSYEKTTKAMMISSIVIGSTMAVLAVVVLIVGLALYLGSDKFLVELFIALGAAVIILGVCVPLFCVALKRRAVLELYNSYSRVLNRSPHNAIEEIAQSKNIPKEKIVADFVMLNSLGFFDGVYINESEMVVNTVGDESKTVHEFKCPNCGGVTQNADDQNDQCAFCGTIKEKDKE